MLRLLGGGMILTGCLGLGMWYRQQFILRLKAIRVMVEILEILMSEIGYGKATLPECCRRVATRQPEPYRTGLLHIYTKMQENEGVSFSETFCACMEEVLKDQPVTTEDKEHFLAFAKGEAFEDGRMQLRTIERSRELLVGTASGLEKENAEKCRLAVGLGAMSGLLLLLILL